MRVLMITQAVDAADPLLAFTVDWVRALAARVHHVHLVCLRSGAHTQPPNVTTWEIGARTEASRLGRWIAFEQTIAHLMDEVDVVFAHMSPRYACACAPLALVHGRPIVFWYVHRQDSMELRAATVVSAVVATAVPDSFPFPTRKLRPLGHGVDAEAYAPDLAVRRAAPPLVAFVGRLMPIKHQATLLRALDRLKTSHPAVQATFVGDVPEGQDRRYARSLRELSAASGLESRVTFAGARVADEVRDVYRRATIAVNLSPTGLLDKAALESMMAGTPTIVASASFDDLLRAHASLLRVASPEDDAGLAEAIAGLLEMSEDARARMASEVRVRTVDGHGLDRLMERLVVVLDAAARAAR